MSKDAGRRTLTEPRAKGCQYFGNTVGNAVFFISLVPSMHSAGDPIGTL